MNTRNSFFKTFAGFGRSLNRLYENRNHDIYSNGEVTVMKKIGQTNPSIIIDGGANIGTYALNLAKYCSSSKIYCFEPVGNTYNILKKNTSDIEQIFAINKGLFSENCSKEINIFDSNTHSSLYVSQKKQSEKSQQCTIELIKGDDFVKQNNIEMIDFLKIDIEGAEYEALIGFSDAIENNMIKAIQFEYGTVNIVVRKLLIDFHEFLENHGYVLGKIFPKHVEFRKYELSHEDFLGPNFIAVKKNDTALIELLSNK